STCPTELSRSCAGDGDVAPPIVSGWVAQFRANATSLRARLRHGRQKPGAKRTGTGNEENQGPSTLSSRGATCLAVGLAKAEVTWRSSTSFRRCWFGWIATPSCLRLAMTVLGGTSSRSSAGNEDVARPIAQKP